MRIVSRKTLRYFWEQHPKAQKPLESWLEDAKKALWKTPNDIKNVYQNVSIVANNRVVFNIKGNDDRLVLAINYECGIAYIRFIGTHKEYDQIDVTTI